MLCAHTVRRLKPGMYEAFMEAFMPGDDPPAGWVRFHALRDLADPDRIVTFGFFDGTLEQLEASQDDHDFAERRAAIAPFVEEVVLNGVYAIAETRVADGSAA